MVNNLQHLCQTSDIPAKVALNDFIGMDKGAIVVQVTKDGTVSKILMERDVGTVNNVAQEEEGEEEEDGSDSDGDDDTLPLLDATNMVQSLHHFLMIYKDVLDCVLESCNIIQEHTEKSILKQTVHYNYFIICNYPSDIFIAFHQNEFILVTHMTSSY
jgi:hypothetical protein